MCLSQSFSSSVSAASFLFDLPFSLRFLCDSYYLSSLCRPSSVTACTAYDIANFYSSFFFFLLHPAIIDFCSFNQRRPSWFDIFLHDQSICSTHLAYLSYFPIMTIHYISIRRAVYGLRYCMDLEVGNVFLLSAAFLFRSHLSFLASKCISAPAHCFR